MAKYIYIKVDTCDADYQASLNAITDEEIELIAPLIKSIMNTERHNYDTRCIYDDDLYEKLQKEYQFSQEVHETFIDLCPSVEEGFHTVAEVKIIEGNLIDFVDYEQILKNEKSNL